MCSLAVYKTKAFKRIACSDMSLPFQGGMAGLAMPEPPVPRPPCRNPDYIDEHLRLQSFHGRWPHGPEVQDVRKMAKYGLYFTGRLVRRNNSIPYGARNLSHINGKRYIDLYESDTL